MSSILRIVQLSDTHFLEDDATPEGAHVYNTNEAFDAVREHLVERSAPDLIVGTGDIADHGRAAQYDKAFDAFASLPTPINLCPGNHDFVAPLAATLDDAAATDTHASITSSPVVEIDDWAFLFVDTSAGLMQLDDDGNTVDPPGPTRLHNNGNLGQAEADRIQQAHDDTDAAHVFIWLHHPPAPPMPLCDDAAYAAEWAALLPKLPKVRGLGGGHTHVPDHYQFEGQPVFVCPSLKNNFSINDGTWLPPGYRTYEFNADGTITSEAHFTDDERWPRRPLGGALTSLLNGEITYDELAEIIARRKTSGGAQ